MIDLGGEPIKNTDYTGMGRVSEFRYGKFLSEVFRKKFGQKLNYLKNFGAGEYRSSVRNDVRSICRVQAGE